MYLLFTPMCCIWSAVLENSCLKMIPFFCQSRRSMLKESVQELTHSSKRNSYFPNILKIDYCLKNVFSTATYDLDWWPLDVFDEGLYRSRRRKKKWTVENSASKISHSQVARSTHSWINQQWLRRQEDLTTSWREVQSPTDWSEQMQRQNTKYSE